MNSGGIWQSSGVARVLLFGAGMMTTNPTTSAVRSVPVTSLPPFAARPGSRLVITPIHRWDLPAVAAVLPAAPYRTHADDLDWQATGEVTELIAWRGVIPVGAGFIHWRGPRDASVKAVVPACPEIFRLEVLPEHRSLGVGAALIAALEGLALARAEARIGLGVGIANVRARSLYERLGYRPAGAPIYVDRCEKPGPDGRRITSEEPCIYMVKHLAAPIAPAV